MQKQLKAVLLDIDGTLLDSNDAHALCWIAVLKRHGFECEFAKVRSMMGEGGDKVLPELAGLPPGNPEFEKLSKERTSLFKNEYLPKLGPTNGARALLEGMKSSGLKLVVATSAGDELPLLLERARVADLIDISASSEDAESSKPDPGIVHAALAKCDVEPGSAVMIGDTPYDIEAANAAGVRCIALRCGGWWQDADLASAAAIYDHPAALLSDLARWLGGVRPS